MPDPVRPAAFFPIARQAGGCVKVWIFTSSDRRGNGASFCAKFREPFLFRGLGRSACGRRKTGWERWDPWELSF